MTQRVQSAWLLLRARRLLQRRRRRRLLRALHAGRCIADLILRPGSRASVLSGV